MATDENKKTMRFWIFSGIVAIVASQLPFIVKKGQQQDSDQSQQQQQKGKTKWIKLLIGVVIIAAIGLIFWLMTRFA